MISTLSFYFSLNFIDHSELTQYQKIPGRYWITNINLIFQENQLKTHKLQRTPKQITPVINYTITKSQLISPVHRKPLFHLSLCRLDYENFITHYWYRTKLRQFYQMIGFSERPLPLNARIQFNQMRSIAQRFKRHTIQTALCSINVNTTRNFMKYLDIIPIIRNKFSEATCNLKSKLNLLVAQSASRIADLHIFDILFKF